MPFHRLAWHPTEGRTKVALMIQREFYRLPALAERWACTVDDLLHLGANTRAQICVNIYGPGVIYRHLPGIVSESFAVSPEEKEAMTDEQLREAQTYTADLSSWMARTTKNMPPGVFALARFDLRLLEKPGASPYVLCRGLKFDDGWWRTKFEPPVTITLDHLCILHEEVQRLDREVFGAGARARDAESASALPPPRDEAAGPTAPQQGGRVDSPKPVQRQAAQEQAILAAIQQLGAAPLKLTRPPSGKSGIKARVCGALYGEPLFAGTTVFARAWERLMKRGAIAYAD